MRGLLLGLVAGALMIGAAGAQERCDPWQAPPVVAKPAPTSPVAPPPPPQFYGISGGSTGPEIVLLGDSLTTNHFGLSVAKAFGDREYRVYAIGGKNAQVLSSLFEKETIPPDAVAVIWLGRNNNPADPATLLAGIKAAVAHVPSGKYLVLSVLSGRNPDEQPGGTRRALIDALNDAIRTVYGDRFIEVRPLLTCSDFEDDIHLLHVGHEKVARAVSDAMLARGW